MEANSLFATVCSNRQGQSCPGCAMSGLAVAAAKKIEKTVSFRLCDAIIKHRCLCGRQKLRKRADRCCEYLAVTLGYSNLIE
jgi:hypothetical protein